MAEEESSVLNRVAPGAITALLRETFRSSPDRRGISGFQCGQVVGRFELVRKLGRGGFGVVFEALDRTLGRAVAFKAVRTVGDVDRREEMLLREAEAAAQLSHPNIVTLHDVGQCEHGPYLVMELLRGRTLGEQLEGGAVPVAEALRIAIEVAKGVAHAHARGVIHRDLKPGNVFLCEDGHVKVLDFGMARAFGRPKVDGGTAAYMAPEQRRGEPEDERTDVFALGVMLHEMLTGTRPRRDLSAPLRAAAPAGTEDAPRLDLPEASLADLVARMMAEDPVDRPRDGREVLAALDAVARGPVGALPAAAGEARRRGGRARRAPLVAGLAILAVATVALALALGRGGTEAPPPAASATPAAGAALPAGARPPHEPPFAPEPSPKEATAPSGESAPPRTASPARPPKAARAGPAVRYCRGSIASVATPPPASGDGVLTILADPFGAVFVNGVAYGDTPGECRVAAGTYTIRAVHPELGVREARVKVGAGERARWAADFVGGR